METWSAHTLYSETAQSSQPEAAPLLQAYAQALTSRGLPVVFSLGHLSKITGASYQMLRQTVERKRESANYRMYAIAKRSGGRRFIHAVSNELFRVQQFINQEILQNCRPHGSSFAFHVSGGIRKCAAMHCGAKWLFQFDLTDFFYSVREMRIYHIFQGLGYRPLLAFELARLCSTTHLPQRVRLSIISWEHVFHAAAQLPYPRRKGPSGVLPQGAPTSPMLSNLAAQSLDESLQQYALENGFVYTRYADDITISAFRLKPSQSPGRIQNGIVSAIRRNGFRENSTKTRIAGPGSKKLVLGLLVDGDKPRLSRETYKRIDRLLYASNTHGLEETAEHEGFESAFGFFNHLRGLVAFVKDVDEKRWEFFADRLGNVAPPWEHA